MAEVLQSEGLEELVQDTNAGALVLTMGYLPVGKDLRQHHLDHSA